MGLLRFLYRLRSSQNKLSVGVDEVTQNYKEEDEEETPGELMTDGEIAYSRRLLELGSMSLPVEFLNFTMNGFNSRRDTPSLQHHFWMNERKALFG